MRNVCVTDARPEPTLFERVRDALRAECVAEPRVLCAALSPDGLEFSLHGTSEETEMYEVGAAIGARVEDIADPTIETTLHGGWTRVSYPPAGWVVAFSRSGA